MAILAAILATTSANALTLEATTPPAMTPNQRVSVTFEVTNDTTTLWYLDSMGVVSRTGSSCKANCITVVPNPASKQQVGWHANPEAPIMPGASYPWTVTFVAGPGPAKPGGVVNDFQVQAFVELDHKETGRTTLTMSTQIVAIGAP